MNTNSPSTPAAVAQVLAMPESSAAWVSALVDGELASDAWDDAQWAKATASEDGNLDLVEDWHSHHLIGEVLRGDFSAVSVTRGALTAQGAQSFARQVLARAHQDMADESHSTIASRPAASAVMPVGVTTIAPPQRAAANDGVFRWKLVAGLASVTAVASVTWALVGLAGGAGSQGSELAKAPQSAPATVVVATEQGLIERDARMQALMQAHRQAGGANAWQVPAGFLRAATHDDVQR